jgi:hypothetical protein
MPQHSPPLPPPKKNKPPGVEDQVPDDLPPNEYYEYFKPDYKLHLQVISRSQISDLRSDRSEPADPLWGRLSNRLGNCGAVR